MRVVIPWFAILAMTPRFRGPEINATFDLQGENAVELHSVNAGESLDFFVILPHETTHLDGSLGASNSGSIECRKMLAGDGVALWRASIKLLGAESDRCITIALVQTADEAVISVGRISVRC